MIIVDFLIYFVSISKNEKAFQGSGLEILLFCAFSGTFFVAACTVSLCRRPRNLNFSHSQLNTIATNIPNIEQIERMEQQEIHVI